MKKKIFSLAGVLCFIFAVCTMFTGCDMTGSVFAGKDMTLAEALSSVNDGGTIVLDDNITLDNQIVINKKVLEKCLINGKPIKDDKIYKVATIDFLLDGGDNVYALKYASKVIKTEKKLMDVYIDHIKSETAKGKVIDQKSDSRITIIK